MGLVMLGHGRPGKLDIERNTRYETGKWARPAAVNQNHRRDLVTGETAQPGTEPSCKLRLRGTLARRIKRSLPDREGGRCRVGADRPVGPGYASTGSEMGRMPRERMVPPLPHPKEPNSPRPAQSMMSGLGTIVALTQRISLAARIAAAMPSSENGNRSCISRKGY